MTITRTALRLRHCLAVPTVLAVYRLEPLVHLALGHIGQLGQWNKKKIELNR